MEPGTQAFEWDARLDGKGYHLTTISGKPELYVRWPPGVQPQTDDEPGFLLGDAIEVSENRDFSGTLFTVRVGATVYLTGKAKGRPAELQRVEELVQVDNPKSKVNGTFWIFGTTFWRAERLKMPDTIDWRFKELLLCMKVDNGRGALDVTQNRADKWLELVRPGAVRCDDPDGFEDADHKFFFRRQYFPKTGELVDLQAAAPAATAQAAAAPAAATAAEAAPDPDEEPVRKRAKPGEHKARIDGLAKDIAELRGIVSVLQGQVAEQQEVVGCVTRLELLVAELSKSHT